MTQEQATRIERFKLVLNEAYEHKNSHQWLRDKLMGVYVEEAIDLDSGELREELLNYLRNGVRGVDEMSEETVAMELVDVYIDSDLDDFVEIITSPNDNEEAS